MAHKYGMTLVQVDALKGDGRDHVEAEIRLQIRALGCRCNPEMRWPNRAMRRARVGDYLGVLEIIHDDVCPYTLDDNENDSQ